MTAPDFPALLPAGALAVPDPDGVVIEFVAVPRQRVRRRGWSEERQRAFIAALCRCASVAAAARSVGMTPRSAYRLTDAPGADGFVAAWDQAIEIGMARLRVDTLDRSLHGSYVPVYRRGKLVKVEHRRNDRLAIAILGGRHSTADDLRRSMASRRAYRQDMAALDDARAIRDRQMAEAETQYTHSVQRLTQKVIDGCGGYGPRISQL